MHIHAFSLCVIASCASGLWIKPALNSSLLTRRTGPTFSGDGSLGSIHSSKPKKIVQRTDSLFGNGDFGKNWEGDSKKELLQGSFPDVYDLILTTLNNWDDQIFNHWFPPGDKEKVQAVFKAVVKNQDEAEGSDRLRWFTINPEDWLAGSSNDLCAVGADAYTRNLPGSIASGFQPYSITHFCELAYGTEEADRAPTLGDLECEDFNFGTKDAPSYRLTSDMEPIAATVLHEMMHFNTIGGQIDSTQTDDNGAIIGDVGGPEPNKNFGEPYWAWILRAEATDVFDPCIINADSYVWLALESFWTYQCKESLGDQGGYFNAPQKPS